MTQLSLFDQVVQRIASALRPRPPLRVAAPSRRPRSPRAAAPAPSPMQQKYDAVVQECLATYGIKVRKWRKNSSGVARLTEFQDGSIRRTLESPYPCGPMSMAIFLHEVGHHAIGFNVYAPRCLEEYHAWAFAIAEMEKRKLNITDAVRFRMHRSLKYAIDKARRRGLRTLPPELVPFDSIPKKP